MGNLKDKEDKFFKMVRLENQRQISLWIIGILRAESSAENPMTVNRIAGRITELADMKDGVDLTKTVRRKLEDLEKIGRNYESKENDGARNLARIACAVYGGRVVAIYGKERGIAYTFEPILDQADIGKICSIIESSPHVSRKEISHYLTRISSAFSFEEEMPYHGMAKDFWDLPASPDPDRKSHILQKIGILHRAIEEGCQVDVLFGEYRLGTDNRPVFSPNPSLGCVRYNPFRIINIRGKCFVVVTSEEDNVPQTICLEEIYEVAIATEENEEGLPETVKRAPAPKMLKTFMAKMALMYPGEENDYPIYSFLRGDFTICRIMCSMDKLSVPLDYFGDGVKDIKKKTGDENSCILEVISDYQSLKEFFLGNFTYCCPLDCETLKEDVRDTLLASIKKFDG